MSSASLDSAIGDVYSMPIQTPRSDPEQDDHVHFEFPSQFSGGHGPPLDPMLGQEQGNIPLEAVLQESSIIMPDTLPTPCDTPPLLRKQRKKYQAQMNASMEREER